MPTASRPTVFALDETAPDPTELIAAIRESGAARWLLLGSGDAVEPVRRLAAAVLAGTASVFGLAGVVLVGASEGVDGVPTLLLGEPSEDAVESFWHEHAGRGPEVPADFAAMLGSGRVTARTRGIHARRALADDPAYEPRALGATQLATLRAIAERAVPQDGPEASWIDLAARVDAQLARGEGDGWRHVDLPPDLDAYRAGLDQLAGLADRTAEEQDDALRRVDEDGGWLGLWFEDARNDLVRQWVAHPATMARIGYDGLAGGGDDGLVGFERLEADAREPWEPVMLATPTTMPTVGATR